MRAPGASRVVPTATWRSRCRSLRPLPLPLQLWIGGQWVDALSGKTFAVLDPRTGEEVYRVAGAWHWAPWMGRHSGLLAPPAVAAGWLYTRLSRTAITGPVQASQHCGSVCVSLLAEPLLLPHLPLTPAACCPLPLQRRTKPTWSWRWLPPARPLTTASGPACRASSAARCERKGGAQAVPRHSDPLALTLARVAHPAHLQFPFARLSSLPPPLHLIPPSLSPCNPLAGDDAHRRPD